MKISVADIDFVPTNLDRDFEVYEGQQRQNLLTQLDDLAESMKEQGQLQAISVRAVNGLPKQFALNFGEKRLRAAIKLGWTEIEVVIEDMTERQADIRRTHENLKRFNLPWWEQAVLVEKLHSLRQDEHGVAKTGRPPTQEDKKGWSLRDTAEELGAALGAVSEDINLARAVRLNPALRNVSDRKTAIRLVRQEARRVEAEIDATSPKSVEVNQVFLGDSASILKLIPDCSIDCCITDPPWLRFFDEKLTRDERTFPVFKEVYRVLKFGTICYIFIGFDDFPHYCGFDRLLQNGTTEIVKGELARCGFDVAKTPLIWHKRNALSRRGVKAWEYDRNFELIVVAAKGAPVLTSPTRLSGVKDIPAVAPRLLVHPHEKPVALVADLLKDSTYDGAVILDPFAGSGVLGQACAENRRKYILIERDKDTYDKILKRLGKEIKESKDEGVSSVGQSIPERTQTPEERAAEVEYFINFGVAGQRPDGDVDRGPTSS
jgi:adenine-specific DNA-methyltransferase